MCTWVLFVDASTWNIWFGRVYPYDVWTSVAGVRGAFAPPVSAECAVLLCVPFLLCTFRQRRAAGSGLRPPLPASPSCSSVVSHSSPPLRRPHSLPSPQLLGRRMYVWKMFQCVHALESLALVVRSCAWPRRVLFLRRGDSEAPSLLAAHLLKSSSSSSAALLFYFVLRSPSLLPCRACAGSFKAAPYDVR